MVARVLARTTLKSSSSRIAALRMKGLPLGSPQWLHFFSKNFLFLHPLWRTVRFHTQLNKLYSLQSSDRWANRRKLIFMNGSSRSTVLTVILVKLVAKFPRNINFALSTLEPLTRHHVHKVPDSGVNSLDIRRPAQLKSAYPS
jgi:hypothetical protein